MPRHSLSILKSSCSPILLVLLILFLPSSAPALAYSCTGIPDEECNALHALYESTNGDGWYDNTNWLSSSPAGTWYGITIGDGHVTGIELWHNGLNWIYPS